MRKYILAILLISTLLLLTGCSKVADEKQMQLDLESNTQFDFLEDEEKIEELVIEKRQTDKKQKLDTVWCTITTAKEGISYQKEVILTYGLYDKGWILDDVSVNDFRQWIQTPLEGIAEDNISASLNGQSITIDGEEWNIMTNNIKNISVDKHDTDLDKKTDIVTATLTLEEEVEEANGKLTINYIFDNGWKIDTVSNSEEFITSIKPEAALEITNEDLIAKVSEQSFVLEAPRTDGIVVHWASEEAMHTVTINSSEISNFVINSQESLMKGTRQIYHCQCTLTKPHVVFNLEIEIPWQYHSGEWDIQTINITPQCESLDIVGEWTGTCNDAPFGGTAVLNISDVDENGFITAVYSYYPSEEDSYTEPGSYHVSGTINMSSLDMNLIAGEWIDKPARHVYSWTKSDVSGTLCVDEAVIKGTGQNGDPFVITK